MTDKPSYTWTAPSGITIVSSVEQLPDMWWDSPWTHWFWSYTSWFTMILRDVFRITGPRAFLGKRGWWNRRGTA